MDVYFPFFFQTAFEYLRWSHKSNPETKLLLDIEKFYILSCASLAFLQLHGDIPTSLRFTSSFVSD